MWKGVVIEESLQDTAVLAFFVIVETQKRFLEGEIHRGTYTFHNVEVDAKDVDLVLQHIAKKIKNGWYFHLVHGDTLKVVFSDKTWTVHKNETQVIKAMKEHGVSQGILPQQLGFEHLFTDPFI